MKSHAGGEERVCIIAIARVCDRGNLFQSYYFSLIQIWHCHFFSVWLYLSLALNINKIKQAKIKIGKILVGGAIKENVSCICVWGFYKNDVRCVVWF